MRLSEKAVKTLCLPYLSKDVDWKLVKSALDMVNSVSAFVDRDLSGWEVKYQSEHIM